MYISRYGISTYMRQHLNAVESFYKFILDATSTSTKCNIKVTQSTPKLIHVRICKRAYIDIEHKAINQKMQSGRTCEIWLPIVLC